VWAETGPGCLRWGGGYFFVKSPPRGGGGGGAECLHLGAVNVSCILCIKDGNNRFFETLAFIYHTSLTSLPEETYRHIVNKKTD